MNFQKTELQALEIIRSGYLELFEEVNKKNYKNADVVELGILHSARAVIIRQQISERLGIETMMHLESSTQLYSVAFFGEVGSSDGVHHFLNNDRMFWGMFGYLIENDEYPSLNMENVIASTKQRSRLTLPHAARSYAVSALTVLDQAFDSILDICVENNSTGINLDYISNKIRKELKQVLMKQIVYRSSSALNFKKNQTITVFRGFDVATNEYVRNGKLKKNNPYASEQVNGLGLSYTIDEATALRFAINKHTVDPNGNTYAEMRSIKSAFSINACGINVADFASGHSRRSYVAKYEVDTRDIILDCSGAGESELMIFPSSCRLIDYRPVKYS